MNQLEPSVLRPADVLSTGLLGLRSRRGRSALTALGIAIGIAALIAVIGISASSRANLLAVLDELGTNYLVVAPGTGLAGGDASLPEAAEARLSRLDAVDATAATTDLGVSVRRSDLISPLATGGVTVRAATDHLADTLGLEVVSGRWLDTLPAGYPGVVLGPTAASRLGVTEAGTGTLVFLGEQWFSVEGILAPSPLAPELDTSALIGTAVAAELFGDDGSPTSVYLRTDPERIDAVWQLAPATANPRTPAEVEVTRPTDALAARAAASTAFTGLLLGLGGVALLVGGVGIANVMIIAVLERRSEIGIRRALGATRRHIGAQFLLEALSQAAIGGLLGVGLGAAITIAFASSRGWPLTVPLGGLAAGVGAALLVGALAGLYPAARAARLEPADAVRST